MATSDFDQWTQIDDKDVSRKYLDKDIIRNSRGIVEVHMDNPTHVKLKLPPIINKIELDSYINAVNTTFEYFVPPVPIGDQGIPGTELDEDVEILPPTLPEGTLFKSPESPSVYLWYQGKPRFVPGQQFKSGQPATSTPPPSTDNTAAIQAQIHSKNTIINTTKVLLTSLMNNTIVKILVKKSKRQTFIAYINQLKIAQAISSLGNLFGNIVNKIPAVQAWISTINAAIAAKKSLEQQLANASNQSANSTTPPVTDQYFMAQSAIPGIYDSVYYVEYLGGDPRIEIETDVLNNQYVDGDIIPSLFATIKRAYDTTVQVIAPEEFDPLMVDEGTIKVYHYNPRANTVIILTEEDTLSTDKDLVGISAADMDPADIVAQYQAAQGGTAQLAGTSTGGASGTTSGGGGVSGGANPGAGSVLPPGGGSVGVGP